MLRYANPDSSSVVAHETDIGLLNLSLQQKANQKSTQLRIEFIYFFYETNRQRNNFKQYATNM